jgi:hypothetical protein
MELQIDNGKNTAYIKLSGQLDKQNILNAFESAVADADYRSGMNRLWDFRMADLSALEPSTIMEMSRHSAKYPEGVKDVKVALVAERDLEYGLSRMFAAYSMHEHVTVSVFYTIDEAEAWLAGDTMADGM